MQEYVAESINIFIAPFAGLMLLLIDYRRNRRTDPVQRTAMILAIICILVSMSTEFIYDMIKSSASPYAHSISLAANTLYFLFLGGAFGLMAFFIDYTAHRNIGRSKFMARLIGAILGINLVLLAVNLFTGFLFYITPENQYVRGDLYVIQMLISYSYVLISVVNLFVSRKQIGRPMLTLFLVSVLPGSAGATLDVLVPNIRLLWPCFFITLLVNYLFIIRANAMIDSLTGVHNRRSCDEYLLELGKALRRKTYVFAMIDVDKFKDINDTFGHAQGDIALRDVADILRACVRHTDFVGRFGGDEFIIIAETDKVDKICEHIRAAVSEFNWRTSRPYKLALSVGADVYYSDNEKTPQEFLSYVDAIMYDNKPDRRRG